MSSAGSPLRVWVEAGRDRVTIRAAGEIDVATAGPLRRAVNDSINAGTDRTVIDLREVTFMDSSGISVLVWAAKRRRTAGETPPVVLTNTRVLNLLKMTGVDRFFDAVEPDARA